MNWKPVILCYLLCLGIIFGSAGISVKPVSGEETVVLEEKKKIALTFDDGPSIYTAELLDELEKREVKASFFVIGKYAEERPELVKREIEEGHIVGNHTYSHADVKHEPQENALEEIEKANEVLKKITGTEPEFIRPPFGEWNENLGEESGMLPVLWSVDSLDWLTKNEEEIVKKVVTDIEENDIILLHDCYDTSITAAIRIIDILQERGYEFVTVDELLLN